MPRTSGQKLKILYLLDIFRQYSNADNPLSISDIIAKLSLNGVEAERKAVYDDIETLTLYGYEIVKTGSGRNTAYFLSEREFELPELKLLADAVACSKFITESKSQKLIKKLSALSDSYGAGEIKRNVVVYDRVKTDNEHIYYIVDEIQRAIRGDYRISFLYFDYDIKGRKKYHNGGSRSEISPYALCWQEEKYYILGYYPKYNGISAFRVDKMEKVQALLDDDGKPIKSEPKPEGFRINDYTKKRFGMFSGEDTTVKLKVKNHLSGVMIDRFGKNAPLIPFDDEYFTVTQTVSRSPIFFGWLFQFGNSIEILSPEDLRKEYKDYITDILKMYNE